MAHTYVDDGASAASKGTSTQLDPPIVLIPYWMDEPEIWDTITIAGKVLPGLCVVDGQRGRKLDKKNAKGADGATISDDGADPTDVDIKLVLATRQQWIDYQRIVPLLDPATNKGKAKPVDVSHPALALHGINSIYIEKLSFPKPGSDRQTREVTIKATGWLPAPKSPEKSKSKTPESSDNNQIDPSQYYQAGGSGPDYYTPEKQQNSNKSVYTGP